MSFETVALIVLGVGICVLGPMAFFVGFVMGRARGHAEGYHRAWGLMGGGKRS